MKANLIDLSDLVFIPEAETAVMPDGRLAQTPDDQWPVDEAPERGWM